MDSLAGYIATLCVGAAGQYLSQFLRPKVKIKYWLSHSFIYKIPKGEQDPARDPAIPRALPAVNQAGPPAAPAHHFLLTQSVTIQNFGRGRAAWVEIVHVQRPDFFQLQPSLKYTESTSPSGEHTLRVESLAPREFFTIQFLCYTHMPALGYIRSEAGHAKAMPWMMVTKYPRWVYATGWLTMLVGAAFCAYWVVKGGIFVLKGVGAL